MPHTPRVRPPLQWRSNCLHGWAESGGEWLPNETWTVFPTPLGMGSTWDRTIVRAAGRVTAGACAPNYRYSRDVTTTYGIHNMLL